MRDAQFENRQNSEKEPEFFAPLACQVFRAQLKRANRVRVGVEPQWHLTTWHLTTKCELESPQPQNVKQFLGRPICQSQKRRGVPVRAGCRSQKPILVSAQASSVEYYAEE